MLPAVLAGVVGLLLEILWFFWHLSLWFSREGDDMNAFGMIGLAADAGLQLVQPGPGHLQIRGGRFIVNFYPSTGTIYVNGTHSTKGQQIKGDIRKAIRLANEIPPVGRAHAERHGPKFNRRMRRKLFKAIRKCHWCGEPFRTMKDATLEHIIPLARGGSHGEDNLTLACWKCNNERGHNMKAATA
jgi:5-methylcytosine-specific restriction endonuclease McrA